MMQSLAQQSSNFFSHSTDQVLGRTEPRIWTRPLRELTPETSYGFAVIDFARIVLGTPLDPWQEFAVIHGGELHPNGKPVKRKLLIVVARQNGKTFLLDVLTKFWLAVEQWPGILTISNSRGNAKKAWMKVIKGFRNNEFLKPLYDYHRVAAGEEIMETTAGSEYYFAAPTANAAGRGGHNDRIILDELRQIYDEGVWTAAYGTMYARPYGQIVCITNQGDDKATILDRIRNDAIGRLKTGKGDPQIGILEWSAPDDSDPLDPDALAYANPNLGRRNDINDLLGEAEGAVKAGGNALDLFKTEIMCMRIRSFDGAINPDAWKDGFVEGDLRHPDLQRVAAIDVSGDRRHVTLMGGARLEDGRIRVEAIADWNGSDAIADMRRDLPGILKGRFRAFGWIPNGPTAAIGSDMKRRPGVWPPSGTVLQEIASAETADICMALAEQVDAGQVVHSSPEDDMLTSQITGVVKKRSGSKWFFQRPEDSAGYADAAYATAVVVHLVRNLPVAPKIRKTAVLKSAI